ncbi:MAG: tripartite tricarboxylate transporter TctB family protein [Xanthobacteraceae bacterium]
MSEGANPSANTTFAGYSVRHNLVGGVVIVVLGLLLLGYAFTVSGTTFVPKVMSAVVTVVGLAVAAGVLPVPGPRDFYGGVLLVDLAILALISSAELPGQRGFAFGPGTAPRLFAIVLAGLSAAVALGGVFVEGERIDKYKLRGPILVVASILAFALMIRPLGLIISSFLTFLLSIFGSREMRIVESVLGAAFMTGFCWLLFVVLLNLPFQLWPRF